MKGVGGGRRPAAVSYQLAAEAEEPLPASSESITKSRIFPSGSPTTGMPLTKKVGVDET